MTAFTLMHVAIAVTAHYAVTVVADLVTPWCCCPLQLHHSISTVASAVAVTLG